MCFVKLMFSWKILARTEEVRQPLRLAGLVS